MRLFGISSTQIWSKTWVRRPLMFIGLVLL